MAWVKSFRDIRDVHTGTIPLGIASHTSFASWSDLRLYQADFGPLLQHPVAVRMPFDGQSGHVVLLPRRFDGTREVFIRLSEDAMERLQSCREWKRIFQAVC